MRARLWLLGVFSATFGVGFVKCRVDDTIDDRIWRCDPNKPECGTKDGRDMTCWQGYCMPSCDPDASAPPNHKCLNVKVLVETCSPLDPGGKHGCPAGVDCYRTDFLVNEGICVPFPVCTHKEECADDLVCATELLEQRFLGDAGSDGEGGAPSFAPSFDHLNCLKEGCFKDGTDCPGGRCVLKSYHQSVNYPDICVPSCDSEDRCPPNYACARNSVSPGADRFCIPGVPSVRCTGDMDCAVGKCMDIGISSKVCTKECTNDHDCEIYSSPPVYFRCLAATDGGTNHCLNTSTLGGFECQIDAGGADCPPDSPFCTDFSPSEEDQGHGECRARCNADGSCDPRAGVPHVCLGDFDGGCYPGSFGLPCKNSSECLKPCTCEPITRDGFEFLPSSQICTKSCESDADCKAVDDDPETRGTDEHKSVERLFDGYCAADRFCRVRLHDGRPCNDGGQCDSNECIVDPSNPDRTICKVRQ